MDPRLEQDLQLSRRQFFGDSGIRLGGIALAGLVAGSNRAVADQVMHRALAGLPHFAPKADRKSVV